ncbi:hypothetical protein Dimus_012370 [Dionaea muscipula]
MALSILIFFFTRAIYSVIRHLQQNLLTSQIIAGMIMGRSLFAEKQSFYDKLFPPTAMLVLRTLGYFGFMIHIFGLSVNVNLSLFKGTGRKAVFIGLSGFMSSMGASFLSYVAIMLSPANALLQNSPSPPFGLPLFIIINSVSSFVAVASHLMNLKLINSELGNVAFSIAVVTDICGWMIAFVANLASSVQRNEDLALYAVAATVTYYLSLFFILKPIILWILRKTPKGKPMKESDVFAVVTIVLLVGFLGECCGQSASLSVFVFGLVLPDGPPLGLMLMQRFETIASGLLLPIFCTMCGLRINMYSLRRDSSPVIEVIIMMGYLGKFAGVLMSSLFAEMPFHDALPLALLLCCKGLVELSAYGLCKDIQVMTEEVFTLAMITMVVVTGILLPIVKYLYDPWKIYTPSHMQTILHSDDRGVLRILVCIHREENVPTMIDLLNASNPTRESPVCVFVLQLMELVGHRKAILAPQNVPTLNRSYSQCIVNAFTIFEKQNQDHVKVHHFMGIAPYATMHNDICSIAHDRRVNIVIVPFHKQWGGIDGRGVYASSHMNIKNVNKSVLKKAPCSVGVLIDRGTLKGGHESVLFSVAMLFLGGSVDDHEALAYSRRMAEHPNVKLLVIWIRTKEEDSNNQKLDVGMNEFDKEIIDDFLASAENKRNITYQESLVDDGAGTTGIARSLEDHVDLVLVGRHHELDAPATSGLAEWSESPELGAMGDMLATWDFRFSVLVVQQQQANSQGFPFSSQFPLQPLGSKVSYDSSKEESNLATYGVFPESETMPFR